MPIGSPDYAGLGRNLRYGDTLTAQISQTVLTDTEVNVVDLAGRGMLMGGSFRITGTNINPHQVLLQLQVDGNTNFEKISIAEHYLEKFGYDPLSDWIRLTYWSHDDLEFAFSFGRFLGWGSEFKLICDNDTNNAVFSGAIHFNRVDLDT